MVVTYEDGVDLVMLLLIAASVWIPIACRREVRRRQVLLGLALGCAALLAILPAWRNGFVSNVAAVLLPACVPLMFVSGGILLRRTHLGESQLVAGRNGKALRGLLLGCLMFVPLGLVNAVSGSPGSGLTWVDSWWMPISLPWFSGITEEVWYRLMLVGFYYVLVRPALNRRTTVGVVSAVLLGAITFGIAHGRTLDRFLTTGLLYGLPMAVVFIRRDLEHSIGAHYMVNAVPWLMVFLEN